MRALHLDAGETEMAIGARLRNVRQAQGLTLAQVAVASGLTKGFLSRVERDEASPSIATLLGLCRVLSLPVGTLFAEPEIQQMALADAPRINLGGSGVIERLISPRSESRLQVIRSVMQPNASGGAELYAISCEVEMVHVLSGSLTVQFVDRMVQLAAGDSLTFPGREPHTWFAGAKSGAEVAWIIVPASWGGTT